MANSYIVIVMITTLTALSATVALKPAEKNLMAKLDKFGSVLISDDAKQVRTNPFSGVQIELTPFLAALVDFVLNNYNAGNVGFKPGQIPVGVWDRAKYVVLRLKPEAYYGLID